MVSKKNPILSTLLLLLFSTTLPSIVQAGYSISQPSSGQVWKKGDAVKVKWSIDGQADTLVDVLLVSGKQDNLQLFTKLCTGLNPSVGVCDYTVAANIPSGLNYAIEVGNSNNGNNYGYSSYFTIESQGPLPESKGCPNMGGNDCSESLPCCSASGYCGKTKDYCGEGCQAKYSFNGVCVLPGQVKSTSSSTTTSSTTTSTSSSTTTSPTTTSTSSSTTLSLTISTTTTSSTTTSKSSSTTTSLTTPMTTFPTTTSTSSSTTLSLTTPMTTFPTTTSTSSSTTTYSTTSKYSSTTTSPSTTTTTTSSSTTSNLSLTGIPSLTLIPTSTTTTPSSLTTKSSSTSTLSSTATSLTSLTITSLSTDPSSSFTTTKYSTLLSSSSSTTTSVSTPTNDPTKCGAVKCTEGSPCCSEFNYCGSTQEHCNVRCQPGKSFAGKCFVDGISKSTSYSIITSSSTSIKSSTVIPSSTTTSTSTPVSDPTKCGAVKCTEGSPCCSEFNYCGSTQEYCNVRCQPGKSFAGKCFVDGISKSTPYSIITSSSTSSTSIKSSTVIPSSITTSTSTPVSDPTKCGAVKCTKKSPCCSQYNYCGSTKEYCNAGCQPGKSFAGKCFVSGISKSTPYSIITSSSTSSIKSSTVIPSSTTNSTSTPVSDPTKCGAVKCTKKSPCCSQYNYCGSTKEYCNAGCQPGKSFAGKCFVSKVSKASHIPKLPKLPHGVIKCGKVYCTAKKPYCNQNNKCTKSLKGSKKCQPKKSFMGVCDKKAPIFQHY
ncbi:hypothetical protein G9A89_008086 [Geosiphon pyriformis]|nr:hypothetical protein G9A89_008086 [Geosiphon pyriformis]